LGRQKEGLSSSILPLNKLNTKPGGPESRAALKIEPSACGPKGFLTAKKFNLN